MQNLTREACPFETIVKAVFAIAGIAPSKTTLAELQHLVHQPHGRCLELQYFILKSRRIMDYNTQP